MRETSAFEAGVAVLIKPLLAPAELVERAIRWCRGKFPQSKLLAVLNGFQHEWEEMQRITGADEKEVFAYGVRPLSMRERLRLVKRLRAIRPEALVVIAPELNEEAVSKVMVMASLCRSRSIFLLDPRKGEERRMGALGAMLRGVAWEGKKVALRLADVLAINLLRLTVFPLVALMFLLAAMFAVFDLVGGRER